MQLISAIKNEFVESLGVLQQFMNDHENMARVAGAATIMADCLAAGGKIISCGNGGSHCDAMHFAEELTGRYRNNRRPLPALAISDSSYITCAANDFGYAEIFRHYLKAMAKPGDVLLAISTSGESENIIRAVEYAVSNEIKVVVLTGKNGGRLAGKGTVEIRVPHNGFADRIQEIHIKIIHALVFSIEQILADTMLIA
jgi:D-sedoheptulose 7-phosphate isomerase